MVSIEMNGAVTDVSAFVQCKSSNEDILKVNHSSSPSSCHLLPTRNPLYPSSKRSPGSSPYISFHSLCFTVIERPLPPPPPQKSTSRHDLLLAAHCYCDGCRWGSLRGGTPAWSAMSNSVGPLMRQINVGSKQRAGRVRWLR